MIRPTTVIVYALANGRYEVRSVEFDFKHIAKRQSSVSEAVRQFTQAWASPELDAPRRLPAALAIMQATRWAYGKGKLGAPSNIVAVWDVLPA